MLFRSYSKSQLSIAVLSLILAVGGGLRAGAATLSPVIFSERPGAMQNMNADPAQVKQMLNEALLKLTSAQDVGTAWKRLGITPQDVVGIKITTVGGAGLSTHHSLVHAICDGLAAAGVPFTRGGVTAALEYLSGHTS